MYPLKNIHLTETNGGSMRKRIKKEGLVGRLYRALAIADKELAFQNEEKSKRADELGVANIELALQNEALVHAAEKDRLYRMLLDSQAVAHIGAYETSLIATEFDSNTWSASPEIYNIFGIDETYPHTLAGWVGFIHPDSQKELLAYHKQVVDEGKRFDHQYKIIRINDGVERWVQGTGKIVYDDNLTPIKMLGTIQDITERKHAEDKLQEMTHRFSLASAAGGVGIWDFDPVNNRLIWDDQMYRIYGIDETQFSGAYEVWKAGLHPEDLARGDAEIQMALNGERNFDTEFRVLWPDGSTHHIRALAIVQRDASGQPLRMIGTNWDITEHKLAEEEKAILQNQLQQSQKMESLGILAGGVAHDMNNVLGAILGLASAFVETQPEGTPVRNAFDTIMKAADRGGVLVKSLLAFARQTLPNEQKLDLNAILKEEIQILSRSTLAKINLQVDLEPDLRPILGDASALTHAFMNLCVNAVDAMPEKGTLILKTRNVDKWIEVLVEDTGAGMPKDVLEKAMDPFFTTKEVGKGTGLGLPMVYITVKAHHGQIDIKSDPGKGTRVRMRFPSCEPSIPCLPIVPIKRTPLEDTATAIMEKALTVLVIDDDEMIRGSIQTQLDHLGHTIILARSGEEALEKLKVKFMPDVVILDINMPGLGGFKTLPLLRNLLPQIPVILITGRVDQTAINFAHSLPYVTLMAKPFSLAGLRENLRRINSAILS